MIRSISIMIATLMLTGTLCAQGQNPPSAAVGGTDVKAGPAPAEQPDWAYAVRFQGPVWVVLQNGELFREPVVVVVREKKDKEHVDSLFEGVLPGWMKTPWVMTYKEFVDSPRPPQQAVPKKKFLDVLDQAFKDSSTFAVVCKNTGQF